jgi:Alpha galactosidase A/Alpha galactosidase C-terminal beta sandwich domain/Carbohydrate binding module (family 35)
VAKEDIGKTKTILRNSSDGHHSSASLRAYQPGSKLIYWLAYGFFVCAIGSAVFAEENGVSRAPALGWSSWSFIRNHPDESKIEAQAFAMHRKLQSHGFQYINLDDFWYLDPSQKVDTYGRWAIDPTKFPHGIAAVADYVHSLGLKFGIYVTPGVPVAAYNQNAPIEQTRYRVQEIADTTRFETNYNYGPKVMYYIDYTKPGAQEFIDSWARLFASWGVDYLKLDGVGSFDISDVRAWSSALIKSGRPIHLGLSNSLALRQGATWRTYANSWRITDDIEAYLPNSVANVYPLTTWHNVFNHFVSASQWTQFSGPGGWIDLDSLEVGNGRYDGTNAGTSISDFFSQDERQTVISWWAITAGPLLLGTDLTNDMDPIHRENHFDYSLLQNDEVLAVDQAGISGAPVSDYLHADPEQKNGSLPEIWRSKQPDGTYAVVLSNLASTTQDVTANWTSFGFTGDAIVRDLWARTNLVAKPNASGGYKFTNSASLRLNTRQSALIKITPSAPVTQYLADAPGNTVTGGAYFANNNAATDGRVGSLGASEGSIIFNNITVPAKGTYSVNFLYFNGDPYRTGSISVNGRTPLTVNFPGTGSFQSTGTLTVQLELQAGGNSIAISAPGRGYAPDFDSVNVPAPTTQYLADQALLSGPRIAIADRTVCTDGKCVTGTGNGNSLVFPNVHVHDQGKTKVVFLYLTGVTRSAEILVNRLDPIIVDFPATSNDPKDFSRIGAVVVELPLSAGANTITITNRNAAAPDFDSIIVTD